MTPQEIDTKIREGFNKEFQGTQDARSELHANFSKQGIRLIEYRKDLIKTIAIISAGLLATPKFLDITPNSKLYLIGLGLLIFTVIFSLLNSKESIDIDEAQTAFTRSKLLPILNRRLEKIKEFQFKPLLNTTDTEVYRKYRESEDHSDEIKNLTNKNEADLENLHIKVIDYPSSLVFLLFISGTFFVSISMFFPCIKFPMILASEIIILFLTCTNFSSRVVGYYAKFVIFLKKNLL